MGLNDEARPIVLSADTGLSQGETEMLQLLQEVAPAIQTILGDQNGVNFFARLGDPQPENEEGDGEIETPTGQRNIFNFYKGPYSSIIELTPDAKRFCDLAEFVGDVTITDLKPEHRRSLTNVGNTFAMKANAALGFNIFNPQENSNPLVAVIPAGSGWTVAINGQDLAQSLIDKGIRRDEYKEVFLKNFDASLKKGLQIALLREKLTSVHNPAFVFDVFLTVYPPAVGLIDVLLTDPHFQNAFMDIALILLSTILLNLGGNIFKQTSNIWNTEYTNWTQLFLPALEVDTVAIASAYLHAPNRQLVQEQPEESR